MPKECFFKLKAPKRQKIISVATKEFSKCGYANTKIKSIVEKSSIATGSFYQYFYDIDDLYTYILICIAKQKIVFMDKYNKKVKQNIEGFVDMIFQGAMDFYKSDLDIFLLGNDLYKTGNQKIISSINERLALDKEFQEKVQRLYSSLDQSTINEAIDINFLFFYLNNLPFSFYEYEKKIANTKNVEKIFCKKNITMLKMIILKGVKK